MIIVFVCCAIGIIWAIVNLFLVTKIDVKGGHADDERDDGHDMTHKQKELLLELGQKISEVKMFII